jgi:hypothetical protein
MVVYRSVDGTRLIWADPSAITQGGRSLSIYDAEVRGFTTLSTITGEYSTVMAISSRGRRFLHTADVYDASFRYLGALDSGPDPWFIGVSGNGEAAAAYRLQTGSLHVHDVRPVVGPFSAVGAPVPCAPPESGFVESIVMDDEGTVAFLSVLHGVSLTDYTYHFVVRNLPALPR